MISIAVSRGWSHGGLRETKENDHRIFLSTEDWHEQVQITLGPNVGDITIEYKPPRRGRFTLNRIEAHEDSEDGILLWSLEARSPKAD